VLIAERSRLRPEIVGLRRRVKHHAGKPFTVDSAHCTATGTAGCIDIHLLDPESVEHNVNVRDDTRRKGLDRHRSCAVARRRQTWRSVVPRQPCHEFLRIRWKVPRTRCHAGRRLRLGGHGRVPPVPQSVWYSVCHTLDRPGGRRRARRPRRRRASTATVIEGLQPDRAWFAYPQSNSWGGSGRKRSHGCFARHLIG
jgi:hypothetical protein